MALGATPQGILKMVLANIARWTIAGAALGLLGAWVCGRLMQSLLFDVRAHDPTLLGLALALLMVVALAAALIPARQVTRVDPMIALRYESQPAGVSRSTRIGSLFVTEKSVRAARLTLTHGFCSLTLRLFSASSLGLGDPRWA